LNAFTPETAALLQGSTARRARRQVASKHLGTMSLPTQAEEIWRYSRVGDIDLAAFSPAVGDWDETVTRTAAAPILERTGPTAAVVLVHNGRVVSVEVDPEMAAGGLVIEDAEVEVSDAEVADRPLNADFFSCLNEAFGPGPLIVRIPARMVVDHPVVVVHWFSGEAKASFPATQVHCGTDSQLTVVEHLVSDDVRAMVCPEIDLDLAPAARLRFVSIQDLGARVFSIARQRSLVDRDAHLTASAVALGGDYARVRTDSRIHGKGGSSTLSAAYFADGNRMHDFRTLQDHAAPASSSDLVFKGAVADHARSVYSGLIRVGKEAPGTSAFQTNRNLVLSDGASAESVPNLEIETDDVQCSHASAVGPIDEEQRYYLESRGVPPDVAQRLIVLGFLADVIDRVTSPAQAAAIRSTIAQRLSHLRADG